MNEIAPVPPFERGSVLRIVFAEPLPDDTLALVVRVLAFALVICAAALTPPPLLEEEP